jgi:hypothetical protein
MQKLIVQKVLSQDEDPRWASPREKKIEGRLGAPARVACKKNRILTPPAFCPACQ